MRKQLEVAKTNLTEELINLRRVSQDEQDRKNRLWVDESMKSRESSLRDRELALQMNLENEKTRHLCSMEAENAQRAQEFRAW